MGRLQALDLIVGAFLVFLLIGGVSFFLSVRRGRALCGELAKRFPAYYEELGQPYPRLLPGPRHTAYLRFLMQSDFARLGDPSLAEQFVRLRRSETRQLVFLLGGFGALGAAAVWYEFVRAT